MSDKLYKDILVIAEKYLAKDAEKFVERQISLHLKKTPHYDLDEADSDALAKWCKISGALVMGQNRSEQLANEIYALVAGK
ncbi:MAG: hypothetical protein V3R87_02960 [Dehalococcoidia bacterium]